MKTLLSIVALAALGLSVSTSFAGKPSFSTSAAVPHFSAAPAESPSFEISAEDLSVELADETPDMPVSVVLELSTEIVAIDLAQYGFTKKFDLTANSYKWEIALEKPTRPNDTRLIAIEKPRTFDDTKTEAYQPSRKRFVVSLKPSLELETANSEESATAGAQAGEEGETLAGDLNNDGFVNVDDLLIVINNWGTYDWPTPVDIYPAEEPDYSVDMWDMMIVLTNWSR